MQNKLNKIIEWFVNGETGLSSRTVAAYCGCGVIPKDIYYPHDPADLLRILKLLDFVPELNIQNMASLSPEWEMLIKYWNPIVDTFLVEVPKSHWDTRWQASLTYNLMQKTLEMAKQTPSTEA